MSTKKELQPNPNIPKSPFGFTPPKPKEGETKPATKKAKEEETKDK